MSVVPTGASKGGSGDLQVFGCSKIRFLLYLYVKLQNYEVWIAGKIVAQTGSKLLQLRSRSKLLQLGSRSKLLQLDPDPSSFNLGLGTYCTLPSKILYNPNTHIAYLPLLGDVKTIKMIVLQSAIPNALVCTQFTVAECRTCAGDKQLAVATVAAAVMVVHVVGAFF